MPRNERRQRWAYRTPYRGRRPGCTFSLSSRQGGEVERDVGFPIVCSRSRPSHLPHTLIGSRAIRKCGQTLRNLPLCSQLPHRPIVVHQRIRCAIRIRVLTAIVLFWASVTAVNITLASQPQSAYHHGMSNAVACLGPPSAPDVRRLSAGCKAPLTSAFVAISQTGKSLSFDLKSHPIHG